MAKEDLQTLKAFVRAAGRSHPCIHYAKVSDSLWSVFILMLIKEYLGGPIRRRKLLVTCVGRQPGSSVWVFNKDTQVDEDGCLIPSKEQQYYWSVVVTSAC